MKKRFTIISAVILVLAGASLLRRAVFLPDTAPRASLGVRCLSLTNDSSGEPLVCLLFTNNGSSRLKRSSIQWTYSVSNRWVTQPLTPILEKDLSAVDWLEPGGGTLALVHIPTTGMWGLNAIFEQPNSDVRAFSTTMFPPRSH